MKNADGQVPSLRPRTSRPPLSKILHHAAYHVHAFQSRDLRERHAAPVSGRPLVCGYLGASIGIGQAARLYLQGLNDRGVAPSIIDLSPDFANDRGLTPPCLVEDGGEGPLLLVVNPPEVPKAIKILRAKGVNLSDRYRILACVWEQPRAPDSWGEICEMFDEVWVPSSFNVAALEAVTDRPVRCVPYPFRPLYAAPLDVADLPVRQGAFNILSTFDLESGWVRKNPLGTIEAFQTAFADRMDVHLILKGRNLALLAKAELQAIVDRASNITLYDADLGDTDMVSLVNACDAVLSLGRAEGFGLLAAEALALGRPAIATGGTGAQDYSENPGFFAVDYDLAAPPAHVRHYRKAFGRWTEPDLDHAARLLRDVVDLPDAERDALSVRTRAHWEARYNIDAIWRDLPEATRRLFSAALE